MNPNLKSINIVSDSPSSQYRNQQIFYCFGNCIMEYFPHLQVSTWNNLEAGLSKGVTDGVGGTVKRTADRIVSQGKYVDCLDDLVTELKDKLRSITTAVVDEGEIVKFKA